MAIFRGVGKWPNVRDLLKAFAIIGDIRSEINFHIRIGTDSLPVGNIFD